MNIEYGGFHSKLPLSKYQGNNWYWQGNKDEYTVFIINAGFCISEEKCKYLLLPGIQRESIFL